MSEVYEYDIVVVGGGIAGFSAALYTARQGLRTAVVSMDVGGQLAYASVIENYPGVESTSGLNLVLKVQQQAMGFGVELFTDEVTYIEKRDKHFIVRTRKGDEFRAIAVILACGKAPRKLGVENEDIYVGKGLSYCVVCDAPLYKGKVVALTSFGEKGVESLPMLSGLAKKVYYVTPVERDESTEKARELPNVEVFTRSRIVAIRGDKKVEKIVVQTGKGESIELVVDGVFVEMGFETRIDFVKHLVDVNEKGEIIVDAYGRTRTEGLFAAGDITPTPYKQAVIAAASAVVAALTAINYVNNVKGVKKTVVVDWEKKVTKSTKRFRL